MIDWIKSLLAGQKAKSTALIAAQVGVHLDAATRLLASERTPVNTKKLYNICTVLDQRRRRWADVVQML